MVFSKTVTNLKAHAKSIWKNHKLPYRAFDLFLQSIGYLIITLLLMVVAIATILYLLPSDMQQGSIKFLTLIYMCCLGIVTARSFDTNSIRFLLSLIAADVENIQKNTNSLEIEGLRQSITNLDDRLGPP